MFSGIFKARERVQSQEATTSAKDIPHLTVPFWISISGMNTQVSIGCPSFQVIQKTTLIQVSRNRYMN